MEKEFNLSEKGFRTKIEKIQNIWFEEDVKEFIKKINDLRPEEHKCFIDYPEDCICVGMDKIIDEVNKLAGDELIDTPFDLGIYGKRIQFEVYNETKNEDFYLSQLMTDYKQIGKETN